MEGWIKANIVIIFKQPMGLEIYLLKQPKECIATLESIDSIASALDVLYQKTGLSIDEYGDTKLSWDHIHLLMQHTDDSSEWKTVLERCSEEQVGLFIVGD